MIGIREGKKLGATLLLLCAVASSYHLNAASSPVLRFDRPDDGSPITVRWIAESVARDEPYVHYDFQAEISNDLGEWSPNGDPMIGGFAAQESISHELELDVDPAEGPVFVRVTYHLNLPGADLSGRDLSGADLRGSDLSGADLSGADLSGADLSGAVFTDSDLTNVNMSRSVVGEPTPGLVFSQLGGDQEIDAAVDLPSIFFAAAKDDFSVEDPNIAGIAVSIRHANVMLAKGASIGDINTLLSNQTATLVGSEPAGPYFDHGLITIELPTSSTLELLQACAIIELSPDVEICTPELILGFNSVTDDSEAAFWAGQITNWWGGIVQSATYLWDWKEPIEIGRGNWGLKYARVPQMWNVLEALEKVSADQVETVVIDGGFEIHEDLIPSAINGPLIGGNPSHGMHVAGIIAASHGNSRGVDGINPFTSLTGYTHSYVPAVSKVIFSTDETYLAGQASHMLSDARAALRTTPNARIVNMSLGFTWGTRWLTGAAPIERLKKVSTDYGAVFAAFARKAPDVLFVVAAGNDSGKITAQWNSPMSNASLVHGASNIVVVQSNDASGNHSGFSNALGDISAPGSGILSLDSGNGYVGKSGTSQAAPFVSGVAGYLLAADPSTSPSDMKSLLLTGGFQIDAYAALLEIDNRKGRDRDILRMLLDLDDGSDDGNLRLAVPDPVPGASRSFEWVTGDVVENDDLDQDDGPGDGDIDMADFRRWRDWLIHGERFSENSSILSGLNGEPDHIKFDSNRDGRVELGKETTVYPRGDFNGDGVMDRDSTELMYGYLENESLTDLDVLIQSGLFDDDYNDAGELPDLIDSVDVVVSMENVLQSDLPITEANVFVTDVATEDKEGKPRLFNSDEPIHIYTLPLGKTYRIESEKIDLPDDSAVILQSAGEKGFNDEDVGGDYVVDLVPVEMTGKAYVDELGLKDIQAEPAEEEIDAWIKADNGLGEDIPKSEGARAMANDEGTMWAVVRTGTVPDSSQEPGDRTTFRSEVIWRRSFVRSEGEEEVKFDVKKMTLHLNDGYTFDEDDLRAFAELKLEKRSVGTGEWEEVFYTMAEIAGYSKGIEGPDTFELIRQEGDISGGTFEKEISGVIVGSGEDPEVIEYNIGATYNQPGEPEGKVDVSDVPVGNAFELRYTLKAEGVAFGGDTIAEAVIGDPIDYPSGLQMAYGSFGELPTITDFSSSGSSGADATVRSKSGFTYALVKKGTGGADDEIVALVLGATGTVQMRDSSAGGDATAGDYTVIMRPLDQAEDADGDGIDDAYELAHPGFLDPLDPSDAQEDEDDDQFTNLAEYENGTDPEVADGPPSAAARLFPGRLYPIGGSSRLHTAEFNQDGRPDFVSFAGSFDGSIFVTLSNPDGTYQEPIETPFAGSQAALGMVLMDLNGDLYPDTAVADAFADEVTVFLGTVSGQMTRGTSDSIGGGATRLATGDVDGDQQDDLLVILDPSKSLVLFQGDGEGGLTEGQTIAFDATPTDATVGNFDNDTYPDLAVSLTGAQVAILTGAESGVFGAPAFETTGSSPDRVITGDLNADDRDDIIVANKSGDSVSVFLAEDGGGFEPRVDYAVGDIPSALMLGLINEDIWPDLVVAHAGSDFHSLLLNTGGGAFAEAEPIYSANSQETVILGDWNGDSAADIAGTLTLNQALVLDGDGTGGFQTRMQTNIPRAILQTVALLNLVGDETEELVALNQDTDALEIWSVPTSEAASQLLDNISAPSKVEDFVPGLFNDDGDLDLVIVSAEPEFFGSGENKVSLFTGNGSGEFSAAGSLELDYRPEIVRADELNDSAGLDLVVAVPRDDAFTPENEVRLYVLANNGQGLFTIDETLLPGSFIHDVLLRDLNDDGVAEIIAIGSEGNGRWLRVYKRTGVDTWGTIVDDTFNKAGTDLQWIDSWLDGEAGLLLLVGGTEGFVQFRPAEGGSLGAPETILDSVWASGFAAGDVDGDTRTDLVTTSGGRAAIRLGQPDGTLSDPQTYWIGPSKDQVLLRDVTDDGKTDLVGWGAFAPSISVLPQLPD